VDLRLHSHPMSALVSIVPESIAVSGFEGLKADPGKAGVDNLQAEIEKLRRIRAIGICTESFANVP
jgi:hypothetical protein